MAEPAPPVAPPAGTITGQVTLQGETDHSGSLVYLGGTGFGAYTDRGGAFTIASVPPGSYEATAQHEGFIQKHIEQIVVDPNHAGAQQFPLAPVALARRPMTREIIEKALGAIAGVAQYADRQDHSNIRVRVENTVFSAVTDESGSFAVQNLEPGSYTLIVSSKGYATRTVQVNVKSGRVTFSRSDDKDPEVIFLRPDASGGARRTVNGTVELLDANGEPLSRFGDVLVALEGTAYVAVPGEKGAFTIADVAPGKYAAIATAPGFQIQGEKTWIDLENNPAATVHLRLKAAAAAEPTVGAARGRVVLNDGQPPAGVHVGLAGTVFLAMADAQGAFLLANVPAGTYSLVATREGYRQGELDGVAIAAGQETDVGEIALEKAVEPPVVINTSPGDGDAGVTIRRVVPATVQFSQKMDGATVLSALQVEPPVNYQAYFGKQRPQSDYDLLYIEFSGVGPGAMAFATTYRVTVAASASNDRGVAMEAPYEFSFTTGKAEIIGTDPPNGAVTGPRTYIESPVRVFFNAPVRHDSIDERTVSISPSEGQIPNIVCEDDPQTGWTSMQIRRTWTPGARYTMVVAGRMHLVSGKAGVSNVPYRFSFSVAKGEDIGQRQAPQNPRGPRPR